MSDKWRQAWTGDAEGKPYGDVFFARATGSLGEMESSKAAARRLAPVLSDGDRLLDVGCGAGHYYRSIRSATTAAIAYVGLDATPYYVDRAREAFADDPHASFFSGDIFAIDLPAESADVVLCSNVLLHLPSIAKPIAELCRVAKRRLLMRTLVYDTSYVIMDVKPQADGGDFDEDGTPRAFHYLNVYGEKYVRRLVGSQPRVKAVTFEPDTEFAAASLSDTGAALPHAWDKTHVLGGMQASGPILMPWTWIAVDLEATGG